MKKKFSFQKIAKANIQSKPLRSFFLLLMVFIFSLAVLTGSMFINALSDGVTKVSNRMGADIMIVPSGYKTNVEDVLLKGEPSTFYLPADTLETVIMFPLMADKWAIPLPVPTWQTYVAYGIFTLIIGMLVGPLASLPAAWRVSKRDAYTSMRETD